MIVDGLQCGHFDRAVLEALREGGIGCVTVTVGFWEGAVASLDALAAWRDLQRACADISSIARSVEDIQAAAASNRVALLLGFQNSNHFEGRIRFVELFADLGVRVVQLTYNNQNELGGSCYETEDSGLARFGREVVREMNRAGILIDLSHVGPRTTLEAIEHSLKPVAISHANAARVFAHRRNKDDAILRALAQNGGVIGCATYRNIAPEEACASVEGWCDMVARTVEVAGIDHVGIGTDFGHNNTLADLEWMRKGRWTRGQDYGAGSAARPGKAAKPAWLTSIDQLGLLCDGLRRTGFSVEEAEKILYGNWMRVYSDVFR